GIGRSLQQVLLRAEKRAGSKDQGKLAHLGLDASRHR
ncbi:MAG: hypothetical protein RLZ40_1124, partial [Actinomycetota bacterium]